MNRFCFLLAVVVLVNLGFSNETTESEGKFLLPDLFVTAKDERTLDSSNKIDVGLRSGLRAQDNMIDGSLQKDISAIEKMKLSDNLSSFMYNDVSFYFGLPQFLDININHGYIAFNMPYFFRFNSYDKQSIYGVKNSGSSVFVAIKPDKENHLSFLSKQKQLDARQKQLDASELNLFGIAYKRLVDMPFNYSINLFNSNSYAGNSDLRMLQHNLSFDFGTVQLASTDMSLDLSLMYLGSNKNNLFFVDFGLNDVIQDDVNGLDLGLQLWSNKNIQKFNFFVDHNAKFKIDQLKLDTKIQLIHEPISLQKFFDNNFIEMDDANIFCNERFTVGVSVDGVLKEQNETFYADLNYYSYLNVLDDKEPDGYYSLTGVKDLTIMNIGVFFPVVNIVSESVSVRVQYPIVSKKVPNLFNKFIEVDYQKDIFAGKLNVRGSYYLSELGRTMDNFDKSGFFDINAGYEQAISSDWSFGIYLENLLSAGNTYLPDRNFRDTILYGKIKVIF